MLTMFVCSFIASLIAFFIIGWMSNRQAERDKSLTPGLKLLPGDISWQNKSGNVRVFFPVTSSIILSAVLSLVMYWLNRAS